MAIAVVDLLELIHIHQQEGQWAAVRLQRILESVKSAPVQKSGERVMLCLMAQHTLVVCDPCEHGVAGLCQALTLVSPGDSQRFPVLDRLDKATHRQDHQKKREGKAGQRCGKMDAEEELMLCHCSAEVVISVVHVLFHSVSERIDRVLHIEANLLLYRLVVMAKNQFIRLGKEIFLCHSPVLFCQRGLLHLLGQGSLIIAMGQRDQGHGIDFPVHKHLGFVQGCLEICVGRIFHVKAFQ